MRFAEKLKPFNRPVFHLFLITLLGLIAYSNTFDAPFQWDEHVYIPENPIIKDLSNFHEVRYIGYLTFALNLKLHGLDVRGYHVVNIAIHKFLTRCSSISWWL